MPMTPSTLKALQAAVGPEHVSTDAATLASYAWMNGVGVTPGPRFRQWPVAVVLPGSTEEVAAVVKACIAGGLKFRALSSGNGCMYIGTQPDVVTIDLFRMNRIVKIDRVNQMAVIEPYAVAGRVQAEAMKQGLTCHVVGAGPGHSPLASATSFLGIGISGASTGHNARNILSLEWVTPEGEIVRIGTTGDEWFSEEGPGIGFRGMIRGYMGANGALGIFTRIGYKLYPWAGGLLQRTGTFPQEGATLPDNVQFFAPIWENAEAMRDGVVRLNRTGQLFALLRMPPSNTGLVLTASNNAYFRKCSDGSLPEIARAESRFACQVLTVAHSEAQARYQAKVIQTVVAQTGGRLISVAKQDVEILARGLVTSQYVSRASRCGSGGTSYGVADSWKLWPKVVASAEELLKEDVDSGVMANEDREFHWAWPTESRQLWTEHTIPAQLNIEGKGRSISAFLRHVDKMEKGMLGIPSFIAGPLIELFGHHSNANEWMRRIKRTIDPRRHADATQYAMEKPLPIARIWPLMQRVLFSNLFRPVLTAMLIKMTQKAGEQPPVKYKDWISRQ